MFLSFCSLIVQSVEWHENIDKLYDFMKMCSELLKILDFLVKQEPDFMLDIKNKNIRRLWLMNYMNYELIPLNLKVVTFSLLYHFLG